MKLDFRISFSKDLNIIIRKITSAIDNINVIFCYKII